MAALPGRRCLHCWWRSTVVVSMLVGCASLCRARDHFGRAQGYFVHGSDRALSRVKMTGFHLEPVLAGAYILLLMSIAFSLKAMARHTHHRADQYHTGGFRFHADKDVWECPTGMALVRTEVDYEQRVVRYRAPAHVCNHCPIKERCTHSDRGREIPVPMDPLVASASERFQI